MWILRTTFGREDPRAGVEYRTGVRGSCAAEAGSAAEADRESLSLSHHGDSDVESRFYSEDEDADEGPRNQLIRTSLGYEGAVAVLGSKLGHSVGSPSTG